MDRSGLFSTMFVGGAAGRWQVERVRAVIGDALAPVTGLEVVDGGVAPAGAWALRGVAGHARYTERHEKRELDPASPGLGRPEATCAVMIPIRKSAAWWALAQDERRAVFEEQSRHIARSLPYLPRIARRLYHARDLGEPFDFITWFEMAPAHTAAFDELVGALRATAEWTFVEREVEVRMVRRSPA
jgi:chlorite dismutase